MRYFLKDKPHDYQNSDTACTKSSIASLYIAALKNIAIPVTIIHHLAYQELSPLHMRRSSHPDQ